MCNFSLLKDLSFSHFVLWISHSLENSALVVSRLCKEWVNVHDMQADNSMLHLQIMTIFESLSPKMDKLHVWVQSLFSTIPLDSHQISLWTERLDIRIHFCTNLTKQSSIKLSVFSKIDLFASVRVSCNIGFSFSEATACLWMIQGVFWLLER
jgi:hypothetical protein